MNKEMYLTEHLVLPSEATLSQTSELDGVRLSPHFSLAEMSVTDVKRVKNIPGPEAIENLKRLYVSTRPQCEAMRQYQTPVRGDASEPDPSARHYPSASKK